MAVCEISFIDAFGIDPNFLKQEELLVDCDQRNNSLKGNSVYVVSCDPKGATLAKIPTEINGTCVQVSALGYQPLFHFTEVSQSLPKASLLP